MNDFQIFFYKIPESPTSGIFVLFHANLEVIMSNYRKVPVNKFNGRCPASAIKMGGIKKDNNNNVEFM